MAKSKIRAWQYKAVESAGVELVGGTIMDVRRKRFFIDDIESPLVKADLIAAFEKKKLPDVEYDRKFIGQNRFIVKIKKVMNE